MTEKKPPYSVGFRKPPVANQFKPGRSGNPRGRPKGAQNMAAAFEEELNAIIPIVENGKRRRISKRQAIAKQTVNKAVAGDLKAIPIITAECRQYEKHVSETIASEEICSPDDEHVIASIIKRYIECTAPAPEDEPRRSEPTLRSPGKKAGEEE